MTTPTPQPRPRPAPRAPRGGFAALCLAATTAACGTPAPRPVNPEFDLHDPSGTRRVKAVATVDATRDTRYVPALISRLDDEDDAVRLVTGRALKDLTGHDTGYRATMEPEERRRHVDMWRAWWAAHGGHPAGAAPAAQPAPAPSPAPGARPAPSPEPGRPTRVGP